MNKKIRVATRGSTLALTQTTQIVEKLRAKNPSLEFTIVTFKTTGDKVTDRPLTSFRGIGVFVKELQAALLEDRADLAVHSLKDVPTEGHEDLKLAGFPQRICPLDLLITRENVSLTELPQGAIIGTSSPRRMIQLKAARPDLQFKDLRGNLDTRLDKLKNGQYDAIVVAAAGMIRLGKDYDSQSILSRSLCTPAVGQGILALETRKNDQFCTQLALSVNHPETQIAAQTERSFLKRMGGGCALPITAHAFFVYKTLHLESMVGDLKTYKLIRRTARKDLDGDKDHSGLGDELATQVMALCTQQGITLT